MARMCAASSASTRSLGAVPPSLNRKDGAKCPIWMITKSRLGNVEMFGCSSTLGCSPRSRAALNRHKCRNGVPRIYATEQGESLPGKEVAFSALARNSGKANAPAAAKVPSVKASAATVPAEVESEESEEDFLVRMDNGTVPGVTVVEIEGVDQENMLADVSSSFSELGVSVQSAKVLTRNQRVFDIFTVTDTETRAALEEERWSGIKEVVLSKLKRRRSIQEAQIDPLLMDQVTFLCSALDKVVKEHGGTDILEAAKILEIGFESLKFKEDPRKRAELLRYIENMDQRTMKHTVTDNGENRSRVQTLVILDIADSRNLLTPNSKDLNVWASQHATPLWYASFDHTLRLFKSTGVSQQELQDLLNRTEYSPVFTAHPTEARRREILTCLSRIFGLCTRREDKSLSAAQKNDIESEVEAEIEILWRTDEMRQIKPTVMEEIMTGLDYFRYSLFEAVCTTYRYAENSISHVYPNAGLKIPSCIKFGSWIGGDRDGNPFVLPETSVMASLLASRLILAEYIRRCRACQDTLTQSLQICTVSPELLRSVENDKKIIEKIPTLQHQVAAFEQEPYRLKLRIMRHRLEQMLRTVNGLLRELGGSYHSDELLIDIEYNIDQIPGIDPKEDAYQDEQGFLHDLRLIDRSLRESGDFRLADSKLKDLIRLAETFGFHLCSLDVRQESTLHSEATAECMKLLGLADDYMSLPEAEKIVKLADAVASPPPFDKVKDLRGKASESTQQILGICSACAEIMKTISRKAIASYVISMTRQASHVLEVLFLGWFTCEGLVEKKPSGEWVSNMVVSPLFETIPDLEHMPEALSQLLSNSTYKEILEASGGVQEVMLGYSDSCKDGGIFASAYNLYKAQELIRSITSQAGIRSRIFHGRGGTVGRGAGPTHESVLAQPAGSVDGKIKFTEQGEVITYRYGNAPTATYELTVGITGLLKASHANTRAEMMDKKKYFEVVDKLAVRAEKQYRELTDKTEGFYDYFYDCSVVSEIGLINIGSRPARRKAAVRDKTSLRAIPWVFGWAQSRHTLPAWYGVGSGIFEYTKNDPERIQELQQMYIEWPFFRNFLSNVQMSLFKGCMEIALEYARLCRNRITQRLVYDLVSDEYNLTKEQILMISQQNSLMEDNIALQKSFDNRRKYLDPLNHIQVILLGRRRDPTAAEDQISLWEKPLLRTIKAIASNMRNTG